MAELPCPTCGNDLTFLEQYHRYYCHRCGQYAPEGYGDRGARTCPTCGGILSYIAAYDRYYCYRCNNYAPEEPTPKPAVEKPVETAPQTPLAVAAPVAITPAPSESTPGSPPRETALVAAATPQPTTPTPELAPQTPPAAESKPATPPVSQEPTPTPALEPAPVPIPDALAEIPAERPSPPMRALAASKPAIVRVKIFSLKKAELIDLCKAYDLDPSGTKEQVQERLLSYLHDLEAEEESEEPKEAEAPIAAVAPAVVEEPAKPEVEKAETIVETTMPTLAPQAAAQTVLVEEPKPEPHPAPEAIPIVALTPAAVVVEAPKPSPKADHPCPSCGRELAFIAQYNRWYCYSCQRYAPAAKPKMACPTCGMTMRWIDLHQRWWCDSCQKYAPADLPRPGGAVAVRPQAVAATVPQVAPRRAIVVHRHRTPALGIGLIGFGVALWVVYEFFANLAPAFNLVVDNPFTGGTGAVVEFLAFLFVAAGAMIGLSSLREQM